MQIEEDLYYLADEPVKGKARRERSSHPYDHYRKDYLHTFHHSAHLIRSTCYLLLLLCLICRIPAGRAQTLSGEDAKGTAGELT